MQPGSLVFVQSKPTVNNKGEVTPGLVHIYMVSSPPAPNTPSGDSAAGTSTPKAAATATLSAPSTPGGFKSNQFSLIRTSSDENESKVRHSPTILRKSPKRTVVVPLDSSQDSSESIVSAALSESQNVLENRHTVVPAYDAGEKTGHGEIQTIEIEHVDASVDVSYVENNSLDVSQQEEIIRTENTIGDEVTVSTEDSTLVSVEISKDIVE